MKEFELMVAKSKYIFAYERCLLRHFDLTEVNGLRYVITYIDLRCY